MVQVYCKNTKESKRFPEGTSLLQMLEEFDCHRPYPIVSAKVNNVSQGLKFKVYQNKDIEFIDVRESSGMRVYCRSLYFLVYKAAVDVFPGCRLYIEHPLSHGYFCHLRKADDSPITEADVELLKAKMTELVEKDMPFHRYDVQTDRAIKEFRKLMGLIRKDDAVRLRGAFREALSDYLGRFLEVCKRVTPPPMIILQVPSREDPSRVAPFVDQPRTFEMFNEALHWNIIMGLSTVGDVNEAFHAGHASELIQIAEALQEKKIVKIAEEVDRRNRCENPLKLVLITGPSSSGKTTFCKRLSIQLKACGLKPISMSTDDYFVNRADTPKFPDGSYDFDNFETVDHALMERDVMSLIGGEEVDVPEYNFVTGMREYNGKKLKLEEGSILLIEGIHALNPQLTADIPESAKFKIFINTLTGTLLDDHNMIPTSDNRLLRRIVRDYNKGAFTARESISNWQNVLDAEQKWIYPFQESADVMFNSAYLIEFAVLKNHAEPILRSVPQNCPEYAEAHRLLKFIHYFTPVPDKEIPATSLLREFIGG